MRPLKISSRAWQNSYNRFDDNRNESSSLGQSDFPPSFWMSRGPKVIPLSVKKITMAGIPVVYPIIIGMFLMFALVLDWYLKAYI
jgi:hypothetical protein